MLIVGGSITVQLVSSFTSLEKAASLHPNNSILSLLVKSSLVNWRPAVLWYFPQQWVLPGALVYWLCEEMHCTKGHGFESQHHILGRPIYIVICCNNCNVCLKKTKRKEKEAGDCQFNFYWRQCLSEAVNIWWLWEETQGPKGSEIKF